MHDSSGALLLSAVIIAVVLFVIIRVTGAKSTLVNKHAYQSEWLTIKQDADKDRPESMQMAVIKADKLVDRAMKEFGVSGETMGERLKSRHKDWSNVNSIWSAHKLRNQIAHETNIKLDKTVYDKAMLGFKQALKDLGAI